MKSRLDASQPFDGLRNLARRDAIRVLPQVIEDEAGKLVPAE
jgi:hypothetical protein